MINQTGHGPFFSEGRGEQKWGRKGRRRNVETVGTECISEPLQKAGSVETQALLEKKKSFMKVLLVSELNTLHRKWKVKQVA